VLTGEARGGWGEGGEMTAPLCGLDNASAEMNIHTQHGAL